MSKITRALRRLTSQHGMSLVEVLVAGIVLVVGLIVVSQFFASATARVMDSDIRSVLHQVATEDLERVRGLPYTDVGTTDGHPVGILAPDEDRTVEKVSLYIHRDVVYWTDPSYSGPYPANYRRVTITVSALDRPGVGPVELVSNVAGGVEGGTLDITVTDLVGNPVEGASLQITNDHLVPHVNIHSSAIRTDASGKMVVPGLVPDDTPNYMVTASKTGYNSDWTDPAVVVLDGTPFTVVHLIIDHLSNLRVKVEDTNGEPVEGLSLTVIGPDNFSENIVSAAGGALFSDIRYSTDPEPYVVKLLEGQGYDTQEIKVILDPGTTKEVVVVVPAGGPTTTTTSTTAPVTTTSSSTSTTVQPKHSLRVTVVDNKGKKLQGATVTLSNGQKLTTPKQGFVMFDNLDSGTYGLTVEMKKYVTYNNPNVYVHGAVSMQVTLIKS